MSKLLSTAFLVFTCLFAFAQKVDSTSNRYTNSADNLLSRNSRLLFGGYGEVHYNQPLNSNEMNNGTLDVHRVVMLFGYNFNSKTQFITEIEFEHVKEVYVEQAFLQYRINSFLNFRGGLMLVPMGIINEYHEPTTFNGVERPLIDKYIAPTTWREIGVGFSGNVLPISVKYQAYILNGFSGFDGSAQLSGKSGFRKGRQKGAESFMSSPNLSGKVEFYGIRGLNLGLSGYFGKTQSTLQHQVSKDDLTAKAVADSSVVGLSMLGLDARYNRNGFILRGQFYYTSLSNSLQYNYFTRDENADPNDVGNEMIGYYAEVGYNVFKWLKTEKQLVPFVRYEFYNTHHSIASDMEVNNGYRVQNITSGLTLSLSKGAAVKMDMQFVKSGEDEGFSKILNAGIGVMF